MGVFFKLVGLTIIVAGVAVVIAAFVGNPKASCADVAPTTSSAAANSFIAKWNAFEAGYRRGPATVSFTEDEVTSRGSSYLAENGITAKHLEVHFCPGAGKGQAVANVTIGGVDLAVLAEGHLDVGSSQIVVDSLQIGSVPGFIGASAANSLIGAASVKAPREIRGVTTTTTTATLNAQP